MKSHRINNIVLHNGHMGQQQTHKKSVRNPQGSYMAGRENAGTEQHCKRLALKPAQEAVQHISPEYQFLHQRRKKHNRQDSQNLIYLTEHFIGHLVIRAYKKVGKGNHRKGGGHKKVKSCPGSHKQEKLFCVYPSPVKSGFIPDGHSPLSAFPPHQIKYKNQAQSPVKLAAAPQEKLYMLLKPGDKKPESRDSGRQ